MGIGGVITYKNAGVDKWYLDIAFGISGAGDRCSLFKSCALSEEKEMRVHISTIAEKLAEIKQVSIEEIGAATTFNANKIFLTDHTIKHSKKSLLNVLMMNENSIFVSFVNMIHNNIYSIKYMVINILSIMKISIDKKCFDIRSNFCNICGVGELSERFKEHAWKVCIPQKGIEGSNPSLSAKKNGWVY
jgi:hypothetical protein